MKNGKQNFEELLNQGLQAFEAERLNEAIGLLQEAAVKDLSKAEPWYWMGQVQESRGQHVLAAQYYYVACDLQNRFPLAIVALKRLGYINDYEVGIPQRLGRPKISFANLQQVS